MGFQRYTTFLLVGLSILLLQLHQRAFSAEGEAIKPEVISRIDGLGESESLLLGRAQVVGDFNEVARRFDLHRTGPRSRDYSLKMVWAPERGRALFVGANHGKPHRLNDVWEFDLGVMRWILLYPPDNPRSYKGLGDDPSDVLYQDGALVTRRGGPAIIGHAWWGTTYDPVHRQLLFMNIWSTDQEAAIRQLGAAPENRYLGPPLWSFSPVEKRWKLIKTSAPIPGLPYGAMLEYIPELNGAVWHMNNWQMRATWLFEPESQSWTPLTINQRRKDFEEQAPGRELVGYYDPKRKLIVAQQGKGTFHFDIRNREWIKVVSESSKVVELPDGHDARTVFYHDPVSGDGLLVDLSSHVLWSYDPDSHVWVRVQPRGDPMPKGDRMLAYLDSSRNALVVIDDVTVWVYRHSIPKSNLN